MKKTRGFITVATGAEKYHRIAYYLLRSYRHFCCDPLPFAILTDQKNAWTEAFDEQIMFKEPPSNSYLDKLELANYTPYDETIFIDADCLAFGDLNLLFDRFQDADDVSCFGAALPLDSKRGWFQYENLGALQKKVNYVVDLHGGIYFIRRGAVAQSVFNTAKELVADYSHYQFKGNFANPGDEPLIALSMAIHQCRPVTFDLDAIRIYWDHKEDVSVDIAKQLIHYRGETLYTSLLLHWGTRNTQELDYQKQIALLEALDSRGTEKDLERIRKTYDRKINAEKWKSRFGRVKRKAKKVLRLK